MPSKLPVSSVVNVSVNLTPLGAQAQSLKQALILGTSTVIDTVEQYREYTSIADVAADFGTSVPEYLAALLWFQQAPQPTSLKIGRWYKTAAAGGLRCAPLTAAQQAIAVWNAITTGAFKISVDGGALVAIGSLNFSADANLNAVAARINTALGVATAGATCVWNSVYGRFEFTSATTGAASTVAFLAAPAAGTDIKSTLGGTAANSGSYVFVGSALETPAAAAARFDLLIGRGFYGLAILDMADNASAVAAAAYIEGATNKHIMALTTQEAGCLNTGSTTVLPYLLDAAGYDRSLCQYSSSNLYAAVSALARLLTVNYDGNATVITLKFKNEPGIVAESINSNQMAALQSYNCNAFVNFDNDTAIFEQGVMSSGEFADVITNTDWLAGDLQNAVYNALYTSPTKVPQTEQGMGILKAACARVCNQGVNNGMIAPGTWNAEGFGTLTEGQYLATGYYIYSPPVADQDPSQRAARMAVPIQIAAKLAGAIHSVDVAVTVNQ